jgi:hypothetical protein
MKVEFKKTLTVTRKEQEIISTFMDTMEEVFKLDFEENPGDLFEITHAISTRDSEAYLYYGGGNIDIRYQDD